MRNNHGWGLSAMLTLCAMLAFALIISAIIYDHSFDQDTLSTLDMGEEINDMIHTESYQEMEEKIVNAARNYANKYYPSLPDGNRVYVSVKQLQVESMLEELVDKKDNICSGYAYFENQNGNIVYNPFVKCKNKYTTKGYQSEYDK